MTKHEQNLRGPNIKLLDFVSFLQKVTLKSSENALPFITSSNKLQQAINWHIDTEMGQQSLTLKETDWLIRGFGDSLKSSGSRSNTKGDSVKKYARTRADPFETFSKVDLKYTYLHKLYCFIIQLKPVSFV